MPDRLLIVDDSSFSRRMINRALPDSWKAAVSEAYDGKSALTMCRSLNFDYVFLDLTMPGIDGFGVLKGFQKMNYPAKVFVISADVQQGARDEALSLGALAFIPKPITPEKMESFLREEGIIE